MPTNHSAELSAYQLFVDMPVTLEKAKMFETGILARFMIHESLIYSIDVSKDSKVDKLLQEIKDFIPDSPLFQHITYTNQMYENAFGC